MTTIDTHHALRGDGCPAVRATFTEHRTDPYFALEFRVDGGRSAFTLCVDEKDGEALAERLEQAAEVLRSRRLAGLTKEQVRAHIKSAVAKHGANVTALDPEGKDIEVA